MMQTMERAAKRLLLAALLAVTTLSLFASPAMAADKSEKLFLRAFAVDMNRSALDATRTLDIVIERWSTQAETDRLRDTLTAKGENALLSTLQNIKPRAGYIRSSMSLGWDLLYAREAPMPDGGRRMYIGTDRPMSFWEARNRPRSADYEFTLAEIRLPKDGKGEGKLVTAAKITYKKDKNTIEIENYEIEPVRLSHIEVLPTSVKKSK